jgi:HPt (histidine-containing phosphotransfer) domain-containing protein
MLSLERTADGGDTGGETTMATATMERTAVSDAVSAIMARRMVPAPVDMVHLARQTFGSAELEREVLGLFVQQGAGLVAKIEAASPAERGALVHRLKGSARGIGATRVARVAEALEAPGLVDVEARRLVVELREAVGDVEAFVGGIL